MLKVNQHMKNCLISLIKEQRKLKLFCAKDVSDDVEQLEFSYDACKEVKLAKPLWKNGGIRQADHKHILGPSDSTLRYR